MRPEGGGRLGPVRIEKIGGEMTDGMSDDQIIRYGTVQCSMVWYRTVWYSAARGSCLGLNDEMCVFEQIECHKHSRVSASFRCLVLQHMD